jgi:prepilin-type N-terminal cleavage/methylation domain-containing protein
MKERSLMNFQKKNNGYTLIEVLIAIAIFSIGALAVASMQTDAIMKTVSSRNTTEALELASAQAEFLHGIPLYDDTLDLNGNGNVEQFDVHPNLEEDGDNQIIRGHYTIQWAVTDDEPLDAITNIYSTAGPDPLTISKTIMVTVFDTGRPNQPLATLEMIKVWDRDG